MGLARPQAPDYLPSVTGLNTMQTSREVGADDSTLPDPSLPVPLSSVRPRPGPAPCNFPRLGRAHRRWLLLTRGDRREGAQEGVNQERLVTMPPNRGSLRLSR